MSTPTSSKRRSLKKKPTEQIKTEAAKKIQKFFLKKHKQYKINKIDTDICIEETVSIKPDNIYICFNKEGEEKPLVNFFKFKKKDRIIEPDFFINFYNYMKKNIDGKTIGQNMIFKIILVNDELEIFAHEEIFNKMNEKDELKTFILNFIYYNLINNNIDLIQGISFQITHPLNFSEYSGIHKDNSIYTCITYINSVLTTEVAFDTDKIKLEWLKCSPLFRFNTSGKITTLCFSDYYIFHTVPIYEEEGKDPSELNKLDEYETMIEETVDGKTYLKFGDYLQEVNSESTPIQPNNVFYKHEHRKKTKKPEKREILVCMIYEFEKFDFTDIPYTIKRIKTNFNEISPIRIDELQKYKIDLVKEKIELTEDSIQTIRTTKTLGDFELMGGKKKKKRTKKIR